MADSVKQSSVVSGDLIWDYNLVQQPSALNYHSDPLQHTVLHYRAGGAWYYERCTDGSNQQERVCRLSLFPGCQRLSDAAQPVAILNKEECRCFRVGREA